MNILDTIIAVKKEEVRARKSMTPLAMLEKSVFFKQNMPSFFEALKKPGPSIIGEFKRKSPSKGEINTKADVESVARGYEKAGIAAMSILTDKEFFGGTDADLRDAAGYLKIPLLRKDFIIDEYQVIESKSIGASAILLIAEVLSKKEMDHLSGLAINLGLDILFEIHDKADLDKISQHISITGVNNRNLKTFETCLNNSIDLFHQLPKSCLKVAESGVGTSDDVIQLFNIGYDAFLIGETFMRSEDPGIKAAEFIHSLESGIV